MCFSAALVLALALVLGSYGSPFNTLNELTCYMKASCFKFFFKCNWKVLGSDLPLNWLMRISFTDLKTRTTTLCSFGNSIKGKCLSVAFVSKDTLFKISSTDSRVRTTLFSILNTGAGKCCSVGVIWMVTLWYVVLTLLPLFLYDRWMLPLPLHNAVVALREWNFLWHGF